MIIKQLTKVGTNVMNACKQFPMPILSACIAYILFLLHNHQPNLFPILQKEYNSIKLIFSFLMAIPAFISINIFVTYQQLSKSIQLGFWLLLFCLLGMLFYSITPIMFQSGELFLTRYLIFTVIFHLLVAVAAFIRPHDVVSFWQINYLLFVRICTAVVFSGALVLGLISAYWALTNLFGFHWNDTLYLDIILFVMFIFNTVFFVMGIPTKQEVLSQEIGLQKGARVFIQYILIPILFIYLIILYAYVFKIVFMQHIPKGLVCIPVIIYGFVGILTYLLSTPIRYNKSNTLIFYFGKYFFYTLLPLLSLYFIAIIIRIKPYGITEDRYLILLMGTWMLMVAIYQISKYNSYITFIPISLILMLFLGAMGPWGMFQLSIQNQMKRLTNNLQRNHLLVAGKLQPAKNKLSANDAESIRSVLQYLQSHDELHRIQSWLPDTILPVYKKVLEKGDIHSLLPVFSVQASQLQNAEFTYQILPKVNHSTSSLYIKGFSWMQSLTVYEKSSFQAANHALNAAIENDSMVIKHTWGQTFFSLQPIKKNIRTSIQSSNFEESGEYYAIIHLPIDSMILYQDSSKFIIHDISLKKRDSLFQFEQIQGIYLYNTVQP